MTDDFLSPPERPISPRHALPAGATDCHAHVFGPYDRFPLIAERLYSPPELTGERYLRMLDAVGFARGVLVQPTAHGTDCRGMLNALGVGAGRLRGIAVVPPDITDEQLAEMHSRGVRGLRFIRPPGTLVGAAKQSWVDLGALESMAPRLARLGWHAQIFASCEQIVSLAPQLISFGVPLVVDHMGMADVSRGVAAAEFQSLLRLLERGEIWIKLMAYRLSRQYPNYQDLAPFHQALLAANPERLVWGSDWPHVHMKAEMPEVGDLIDVFCAWTEDPALRRRILVDNPAALYDFDALPMESG